MLMNFPLKFQKFIVAGLLAATSLGAVAGTPGLEKMSRFENEVVAMQTEGVLTKTQINYNVMSREHMYGSGSDQAYANVDLVAGRCKIVINLNQDLHVPYFKGPSNVNHSLSEQKLQEFKVEFVTLHEASHCKLVEFKNLYQTGNEEVDNILNSLFSFSMPSRIYQEKQTEAGLYDIIQENYADTLSAMMMIKMHGASKDVMLALNTISMERFEQAFALNNSIGFIQHNTAMSLGKVLEAGNVKKILETKDVGELQDMALKIANEGMWESIKAFRSDVSAIINTESMDNAVAQLSIYILKHGLFKGWNNDGYSKIKVGFQDSTVFKLSIEATLKVLETTGIKQFGSEDEVTSFITNNKNLIIKESQNVVDGYLTKTMVDKNTTLVDKAVDYLNNPKFGAIKIDEGKISEEKTASVGNEKESFNKDKVMNNILKIRGDTGKAFRFNIN